MTNIAGNTNQLGVIPIKTTGQPGRPGRVTRGVGSNKPRIHLVSSKGKIPAAVYAQAIAQKQKNQAANAAKMPGNNLQSDGAHAPNGPSTMGPQADNSNVGSRTGGPVDLYKHQLKNPSGVAKRPAPKHQNNPALAGRFTPQAAAWARKQNIASKTAAPVARQAP